MCILHIVYFTELIIILFFSMNLLQTELNLHRTDAQGLRAWGVLKYCFYFIFKRYMYEQF